MNEIDLKFRRLDKLRKDIIKRYKEIYKNEGFDKLYFKVFLEDTINEVI